MILWVVQAIFELCAMVIAYLTNPIVVLFADEYGNLPKCLRYWQTYDNCLDVSWMIYEDCVPDIFKYDFNKHYTYHYEDKSDPSDIKPGHVEIKDPNFTTEEKIKRYFCRLCWLYRNSNYGFSYEVNGRTYNGKDNKPYVDIDVRNDNRWVSVVENENDAAWLKWLKLLTVATWSVYIETQYCKWFRFRLYIGWKLKRCFNPVEQRAMLAISVNPFKSLE